MKRKLALTLIFGSSVAGGVFFANLSVRGAANDVYLNFGGIRGESRAPGHEGWMDVVEVAFEHADAKNPYVLGKLYNGLESVVANSAATQPSGHSPSSAPPGRAQGTSANPSSHNSSIAQEKIPLASALEAGVTIISVLKKIDTSSPVLRQALATGRVFPSIVMEYVPQKPDGTLASAGRVVKRIEISDGVIAAIQPGPPGLKPTERIVIKSSRVVERSFVGQ